MFEIGDLVMMPADKYEDAAFGFIVDSYWPEKDNKYWQETIYVVKWFDDKTSKEIASDLKRV